MEEILEEVPLEELGIPDEEDKIIVGIEAILTTVNRCKERIMCGKDQK